MAVLHVIEREAGLGKHATLFIGIKLREDLNISVRIPCADHRRQVRFVPRAWISRLCVFAPRGGQRPEFFPRERSYQSKDLFVKSAVVRQFPLDRGGYGRRNLVGLLQKPRPAPEKERSILIPPEVSVAVAKRVEALLKRGLL